MIPGDVFNRALPANYTPLLYPILVSRGWLDVLQCLAYSIYTNKVQTKTYVIVALSLSSDEATVLRTRCRYFVSDDRATALVQAQEYVDGYQ